MFNTKQKHPIELVRQTITNIADPRIAGWDYSTSRVAPLIQRRIDFRDDGKKRTPWGRWRVRNSIIGLLHDEAALRELTMSLATDAVQTDLQIGRTDAEKITREAFRVDEEHGEKLDIVFASAALSVKELTELLSPIKVILGKELDNARILLPPAVEEFDRKVGSLKIGMRYELELLLRGALSREVWGELNSGDPQTASGLALFLTQELDPLPTPATAACLLTLGGFTPNLNLNHDIPRLALYVTLARHPEILYRETFEKYSTEFRSVGIDSQRIPDRQKVIKEHHRSRFYSSK